ncbi:7,8-dihydro-8-oxoguanine triphosphatase-like [Ceratina calcarata]|uniref:Oxidized purine nucleoside triphosphate hydrolase n=1 Tax=Ceratina calcarata TaxID=156304 RepID=A0AAJ7J6U2_9HYME|nr:7,8-dihydro-8-oxoguanine triphosphatase-like [Ceratina calcarata]
MTKAVFSLVFVRRLNDEILLGFKKRGFGSGKWNGFGGKVEPAESVADCAVRELREECGLNAERVDEVGLLEFQFEGEDTSFEVHVFQTYNFSGELTESEEMRPKWFNVNEIPFKEMWPDDEYWFPYLLRGDFFTGNFLYRGQDLILKHNIEILEKPPFYTVFH